jgi:hypothetical protein
MKSARVEDLFALVIVATLIFTLPVSPVGASPTNNSTVTVNRDVTMPLRIVFVGLDSNLIDQNYLRWNAPAQRYPITEIPGISTGTTYSFQYDISFASSSFSSEFVSYLNSVAKQEHRVNVLWNESYFKIQGAYFLNYTHFPINATNTYYPADQVESWLVSHAQNFGGLEQNGYTLMVADLSKELPSATAAEFSSIGTRNQLTLTPHFYNKTYADHDLGIQLNRRYMTSWGGHSRFYFIDISAGPGSAAEQLPVQLAASINNLNQDNPYWPTWLTQYVSDYISGPVYNLFAPDFIYPLNYAPTYRVKIFVFDNRTNQTPPIQSTVDANEVRYQLSSLVPFADVEVQTSFLKLSDYPELLKVVESAASPSLVGLSPVVDAKPIYNWLSESGEGNIAKLTQVTRDSNIYDIPEFIFAFQGDYNFGFTYKESIAKDVGFDRTIWGVSLYDLVLISHSADDFARGDLSTPVQPNLGFGFTNTIIHETGHMLGLVHPFSYDPTENFVSSVMAYYTYEEIYSQFDKDLVQRGFADQLIRYATGLLKSTQFDFANWANINSAQSMLSEAESAYDVMNYTQAAQRAFQAYQSASLANLLGGGPTTGQSSLWIVAGFSFIIGAIVAYVSLRRKTQKTANTAGPAMSQRCSVCQSNLTWIHQYNRWYCYKCQRYE